MSGRLSTCSVKQLSTTSGNKQKTVNRNQEKTGIVVKVVKVKMVKINFGNAVIVHYI